MTNLKLSRDILSALARRGLDEVVLCAGARNAPLVAALTHARGVRTYSFFDERAAAFFALGRVIATERPVVVITTSGTAVAETLSAVIEADLQRRPLIILSADRPKRYRGTGAPQTITQPGLFSCYVGLGLDVEGEFSAAALAAWDGQRPLHVNVCFDEPLIDEDAVAWDWPTPGEFVPGEVVIPPSPLTLAARQPLVLVGQLGTAEADFVRSLLKTLNRPLWLEATSQLRGDPALASLEITGGSCGAVAFDGVIRVGGIPTLRLWRDLEKKSLPVAHFSRVPLAGLPGEHTVHPLERLAEYPRIESTLDLTRDRARALKLAALLDRYPRSEPAWVRRLSRMLPPNARLFLGNSLPIREWDLAADRAARPRVFANRGANGIDGLISTFAGVADAHRPNWALIGDLSTLYDLGGPWAWRERSIGAVTLAVINNRGGKIFSRIFGDARFENRHDLEFAAWAKMWGLQHQILDDPAREVSVTGHRVLEVRPDGVETDRFWAEWEKTP